ncbi:MAG: LptF/LptG family permease [Chlamydiales bacterium]
MPIFGTYLLKQYFKVLILSVLTFITVLVVSRLETIANFAILGTSWSRIALFTLYQIPYVLPLAIPISCLLSSMILFQSMSHSYELTALRSSGFSLLRIMAPLLMASAFLFLGSFYLSSEIATTAHLKTRKMFYEFTSINPLALLQNARIAKLKESYVTMEPIKNGEEAKNLLIAAKPGGQRRLLLYMIKDLQINESQLEGREVSLLTSTSAEPFDHIIIENQERIHVSAADFAALLRPKGWKIANDHLKLSLLRARKAALTAQLKKECSSAKQAKIRKDLVKNRSEIVRRFALSFATFSFTLMGICLGMEISRNRSKKGVLVAVCLAALALISFFVAHELDHLFWASLILSVGPHIVIVFCSLWTLWRIQRGIA